MAFDVVFSERAAKEFRKLDKPIQKRILAKLRKYADKENLSEAKTIDKHRSWNMAIPYRRLESNVRLKR